MEIDCSTKQIHAIVSSHAEFCLSSQNVWNDIFPAKKRMCQVSLPKRGRELPCRAYGAWTPEPERQHNNGHGYTSRYSLQGGFFPREYTSDECYGKSLFIMARRIWEQYTTLPYWPMRDHTANTYLVMLLEGMTNKVRRGAEGSLHG